MILIDGSLSLSQSVTPDDSANIQIPTGLNGTRGLYVGVSGDVKVTLAGGTVATFKDLSAGVVHPLSVKRVWSTDTTATDIVALF